MAFIYSELNVPLSSVDGVTWSFSTAGSPGLFGIVPVPAAGSSEPSQGTVSTFLCNNQPYKLSLLDPNGTIVYLGLSQDNGSILDNIYTITHQFAQGLILRPVNGNTAIFSGAPFSAEFSYPGGVVGNPNAPIPLDESQTLILSRSTQESQVAPLGYTTPMGNLLTNCKSCGCSSGQSCTETGACASAPVRLCDEKAVCGQNNGQCPGNCPDGSRCANIDGKYICLHSGHNGSGSVGIFWTLFGLFIWLLFLMLIFSWLFGSNRAKK